MSPRKNALLLLAHGSPDSPDEVPEFMKHITAGRAVPDAMIDEVRHRYALSGGHKGVVIAPIGFVCDHVEILYDIDIAFRQFATEQEMRLWRPESLNASPAFIAAIADLVSARLNAASGAVSQA